VIPVGYRSLFHEIQDGVVFTGIFSHHSRRVAWPRSRVKNEPAVTLRSRIRNQKSAIDGVSLVELIIVLVGACILLAAAVPSLDRLHREWTLWGAARLLERSLQWGRMHAVATNSSLALEIDPDGRSFHWIDPGGGEPYLSTVWHLPGRIRIAGSPSRSLRFFPRGNAAPAGTFVLQGESGSYRVVVNLAGRIRLERN
jgi:hypothetical protein